MTDTSFAKHRYRVLVNENSHYMDEAERYLAGEYESCEAAIYECRQIVDSFLLASYRSSMTADELMELYTTFGEDPFIVSADPDCGFSAWAHARQRCAEICTENERA
ncbi:MAG TPA: hypothetical protein VF914_01815 [Chloroflexia bacterium]|jgi:hypothetical protein